MPKLVRIPSSVARERWLRGEPVYATTRNHEDGWTGEVWNPRHFPGWSFDEVMANLIGPGRTGPFNLYYWKPQTIDRTPEDLGQYTHLWIRPVKDNGTYTGKWKIIGCPAEPVEEIYEVVVKDDLPNEVVAEAYLRQIADEYAATLR